MLDNIEVLCHSAIRIDKGKIIYVDPFHLEKQYNDADIILITHSHYDHFSEEDIEKVKKEDTKIYITNDLLEKAKKAYLRDYDDKWEGMETEIIKLVNYLKRSIESSLNI